jgi:hypothetical protein
MKMAASRVVLASAATFFVMASIALSEPLTTTTATPDELKWVKGPLAMRAVIAGAGLFVFAAFAYPVFAALNDEACARAQFPVLASFERRSELSRFSFGEGLRPRIVSTTDDKGRAISAIVPLPPGRYPGFEVR